MASVAFDNSDQTLQLALPIDDRHGWGFGLLLAAVATLFLRPADLFLELTDWPLYQFLIVGCVVVSGRTIVHQLLNRNIVQQPVLACLLVLLASVVLSHLSHGFFWGARASFLECSKVVVLYVLIVGLVNTPRRLLAFIQGLAVLITLVASLALLDRYELVSVAALESIVDRSVAELDSSEYVDRIRGTGIFQDPNDFGLILVIGLVLSVSFLMQPGVGWPRYVWLLPCGVLLSTIAFTHSRGALLSLVCAIPATIAYWRSARIGMAVLLLMPFVAVIFSSRMTDVGAMVEGTGQSRIQIWSDSISIWKQYPLFGLGEGLLFGELGVVTHNSFLHCFAELGLLGGGAFVACFWGSVVGLWRLRGSFTDSHQSAYQNHHFNFKSHQTRIAQVAHHRTFVFAAVVAYIAGILTLSRQFIMPTYLILGLASAAASLGITDAQKWRVSQSFVLSAVVVSLVSLVAFYAAVRIFIHW